MNPQKLNGPFDINSLFQQQTCHYPELLRVGRSQLNERQRSVNSVLAERRIGSTDLTPKRNCLSQLGAHTNHRQKQH